VQRVGRSGRKDDECANLCLYATNKWNLLQSIACWLLYGEGFIEPVQIQEKPYDILVHQALSIVKGLSEIKFRTLIGQLKDNFTFNQIETVEIEQILHHLLKIDFLEKIGQDIIIGIEGEKVVNNRDFYSVFRTEPAFKVIYAGKAIGEVHFSPQIAEDANILLAARIWKIKYIDQRAKKIDVVPANDGKKPVFLGAGASVYSKIREKMVEILYDSVEYGFLDKAGCDEIELFRKDFSVFKPQNIHTDRFLLQTENRLCFFTFTGTMINRTLHLLFDVAGIKTTLNEQSGMFDIYSLSISEFLSKWKTLYQYISGINIHIDNLLKNNPALLDFSKYGSYLPENLQVELLKNKYFDMKQTEMFLKTTNMITNEYQNQIK
jgi:ATP-dependent Lhr-like helicase